MNRRNLISGAAASAIAIGLASPAEAQWIVLDPGNLAQSILQVGHMVEQISNQVQQLEQMRAMLQQNPLQLSPGLSQSLTETRALFDSVQGLAFEARQVGDQIRTLYPETWESYNLDQVLARSDQWLRESRASLQRSMEAEADAVRSIEAARGQIDQALSSSSSAEGQTGAIQASNQLLGIQAAQLVEMRAQLAAQSRALSTERMERIAREERARVIRERAFPTRVTSDPAPARTAF